MKCLVSFIDNEIKKKQEDLMNCRCQTVPFADIPFLFSPGGAVIAKDREQVYRVTRVSSTRHRVKNRKETGPDFWKDENTVELDDNPSFVHCTYLDFDGKLIGPVSHIFTIPRYDGQKKVTSLPVFPLQYSEDDERRERLVKRGKEFFEVAGVKHMHYTGLTLSTRDEIDSQVVIDFEEAINRYPDWKPPIQSVLEESFTKVVGFSDEPDENAELRNFIKAQRSMGQPCVEECCASELTHHDEYVEDRRREDYIVSQMGREISTTPSVTIIPRVFQDIVENNTLTDDEYLIMSYRVFGFVLRSRKWHELDMTHVFGVAPLVAGEGFDELVLPPGHGDMVKSMIRQHLRDRKLSSVNRDKTDVVRGKGRGLIMLLHGVPGVGKTSTAECVADLFRRPLFQITSGDLGTTAKEVEDALEENFTLASRWNSILLIDEADVFLAERTKEDFVRNSLVAVFLRMMEYYAGVLFLTTNRVGVFDEAFTSRIHISLYYPPLDRISTLQIFEKNWDRIKTRYENAGRVIEIKVPEITGFAIDYFENNKEGRWNGRQIRNAFQSALALAELDALGTDDFLAESDHNRPIALGRKSFDTVAEAYKGFTNYVKQVYGADFARRARENLWRFDAFGAPRMPNNLNTRLKIVEPAMPPATGQWTEQGHPGYGPRNPQTYYPPQHPYAERHDHPGQRSEYPPAPEQRQHHDFRERWDSRSGGGGFGR
ncbi:P-loop containing nucleoside triphosphate hydrolase protein [Ustulina deusta]|nr:P-loop containing nucleoside triphosphate hydrolase protein [Ustulina deusta]